MTRSSALSSRSHAATALRHGAAALALLFAGTGCSLAGRPPGIQRAAFDAANAEIGGIVVQQSELDDVIARFGTAPIEARFEGAPRTLCYRASRRGDATALVFEAQAAGGSDAITSFRLLRSAGIAARASCVASASVHAELATGGGLRLGLERGEVEASVGPPLSEAAGKLSYRWADEASTPKRYDDLEVSLSEGAVTGIVVSRAVAAPD